LGRLIENRRRGELDFISRGKGGHVTSVVKTKEKTGKLGKRGDCPHQLVSKHPIA